MMTMRERAQLDNHITGHGGEDQLRDEGDELGERGVDGFKSPNQQMREEAIQNATADLTPAELISEARRRLSEEHEKVGQEMCEVENRLKKLHERDSELTELLNRLADVEEGPPKYEEGKDPIMNQLVNPMPGRGMKNKENDDGVILERIMDIMEGRQRSKATTITDLINASYRGSQVNRHKVQQVLRKNKEKFSYVPNEGWKLK